MLRGAWRRLDGCAPRFAELPDLERIVLFGAHPLLTKEGAGGGHSLTNVARLPRPSVPMCRSDEAHRGAPPPSRPDDLSFRHPVYLRHDRTAEGRDDNAWPETCASSRAWLRRCRPCAPANRYPDRQFRSFTALATRPGWLAAIMCGATILPQAVLRCLRPCSNGSATDRVSVLPGPADAVPDDPRAPARRAPATTLSSLRLAVTGAAVIPVEADPIAWRRELTFKTIITGYGLTESTGVVTMCRFDDDPGDHCHDPSGGVPFPGHRGCAVSTGITRAPTLPAAANRAEVVVAWLQT